jgi:hypothetical protein
VELVGRQIGNYVARRLLGRGGMGQVYLAEHPLIGRKVAVKVLHEELAIDEQMVQRLWLEAKSASEIDSEHIVKVLDFGRLPLGVSAGEARETVYLAMELLEGKSLADRFWEEGMSLRDSVDIARQVCRALEASHQKGIVHRDLKPENVFLIPQEERKNFVKILDFGIAKLVSNPYTRTRTGALLGTPAYMSPEQCRGSGEVDARSDVYSLGIMLYELVAGSVPFAAVGFGDVLVAQMMSRPEAPSTLNPRVPRNLEAAILCALEKKPADRFQSMAAFGAALASIALEIERIDEAHVAAIGVRQKTTERDAPGTDAAAGATMVDPPAASDAAHIPVVPPELHARDTMALGQRPLHDRATQLLGGGLHARTTFLKPEPSAAASANRADLPVAAAAPRVPVPQATPTAPTLAVAATPPSPGQAQAAEAHTPEAKQRLAGVSLREALGSTGAVQQLQAELDRRGAPQPLRPDLPRVPAVAPTPAFVDDSDAFLAAQRAGMQRRIAIVAAILIGAMLAMLFLLR